MKIKEISRNQERINIVFEDNSCLEVDEQDYLSMYLYEREDMTKDECEQIIRNNRIKSAKQDAIKFISYKIRSCKEVFDRLQDLGYDSFIIATVIDTLISDKYLDDSDYAKRYVRTKIKLKKISKKRLVYELSGKGISESIIAAIDEIEEIDEYSDIKILLSKKYPSNNLLDSKNKIKAIKYLYSKGYGIDTIEKAIKDYTENKYI